MQGKRIYQEKLFINFQLSEQIPADNLYSRLNELIDFRFLYEATAQYYGTEGQKSIDPVVFMKLMLAGYLENLNSDRRIINALRLRLDIRYFIGYNLDEELPWHSTLSRTRQLYGEHVFTELFKRVLKQCMDKGMVSGRRQAVDSVFIKANASIDSMLAKEILADADSYGQELKANEDESMTMKAITEDENEDGKMMIK
jgi:transposase